LNAAFELEHLRDVGEAALMRAVCGLDADVDLDVEEAGEPERTALRP
jgi:hypothetical protein